MLRYYWRHHYQNDGNENCVYCHEKTVPNERMLLPDFNFRCGRWHTNCAAKFIGENIDRFENSWEINQYMDQDGGASKAVGTIIYKIRSDGLHLRKSTPLTV